MTEHDLKTAPEHFQALWDGAKTAELRKDDRGFAVGDTLVLREWGLVAAFDRKDGAWQFADCITYTGRALTRTVTHILRGGPWLADGYVMLSLAPVETPTERAVAILREYTHEIGHAPTSPVFLGRAIADALRGRTLTAREQLDNLAEFDGDPEQYTAKMRARFKQTKEAPHADE